MLKQILLITFQKNFLLCLKDHQISDLHFDLSDINGEDDFKLIFDEFKKNNFGIMN